MRALLRVVPRMVGELVARFPWPQWDQIAHHGDAPTAPSSSHDGAGAAGISHAPIRCSGRPCAERELAATGHRWAIVRLREMRSGLALNLVPLCNHVIMKSACRSHRTEGPRGERCRGRIGGRSTGENIAPFRAVP